MVVTRNKTPKGQNSQSMSERKVSFELRGKKTPGKTPQKNNSYPVKKQATPMAKGKTTVQEFKGMKGNKVQQKKQPQGEEEDDDDDDEEDDDFELDMDDIDMEDDDDDGGDDDDDDGDDDDEDGGDDEDFDDDEDGGDNEDDDEDDDDEEEQKTTQKQNKSNSKLQKNDVKTPVKNVEQNSKAKTPRSETKEKPITKKQVESMQAEDRRRERDSKSLFVGNLPSDVTVNELKGLSPDIESVNMPFKRKDRISRFAFLMFSSAAKAESNYKTLQNKKLRGESLSIDFEGEKSLKKPSVKILDKVPKKTYNLKRLYVPAVPLDATVADIAIHFPKAFQVTLNKSPISGSASIDFHEKDAAAEGFKLREIEVNGRKLMVYHSLAFTPKENKRPQKKRLGKPHQGARPPAKKMKVQEGKKDE